MFISCPEISIFLVNTTRETTSDELMPSLQFVQKLAQVSSVYRLRSVLQFISYNFSVNVANFVPNFVVKFKSS
jgi:hypothetical protein